MIDFTQISEVHIGNNEVIDISIGGVSVWSKVQGQPNDEIWYTSTDSNVVTVSSSSFSPAVLIDNTYSDGKGVIKFDRNVTSIGTSTFENKSTLSSVSIPSTVTSIGNFAFSKCTNLASANLPSSLTTIGNYAFRQTALTSVDIPASVSSIGKAAFATPSIVSMTVDQNNATYDSRNNCNAIIITSDNALLGTSASTVIPNTVTTIKGGAFNRTGLTTVTIPSSVTTLESDSLSYSKLTSVTIPNSVTSVGSYVFEYSTSLATVVLPNSLSATGNNLFQNCISLTSVTLPSSLSYIHSDTFRNCTSLGSITIPSGVTAINANAFFGCSSLASITFTSTTTVPTLGTDAFLGVSATGTVYGQSGLDYSAIMSVLSGWTLVLPQPNDEIWYTSTNNSVVSSYSVKDSSGTTLTETSNTVVNGKGVIRFSGTVAKLANSFTYQTKLRTIALPSTVIEIGTSSFAGCSSLTDIDMGGSVATIGNGSFRGSVPLSRIEIPQSVTSIGPEAFSTPIYTGTVYFNALNCTSMGNSSYPVFYDNKMTAVEIGVGVTNIPDNAFKKNSSYKTLASITFNDTQAVPTIGANAFQNCADTGTVYGQPGLDYSTVMAALPSGWTLVQ